MGEGVARAVAFVGLSVAVAAGIASLLVRVVRPAPILPTTFGLGDEGLVGFTILSITWAVVGAILLARHAGGAIGWIMVVIGAGSAITILAASVTFAAAAEHSPSGDMIASLSAEVLAAFGILLSLMGFIAFIFPTGRPLTRRWGLAAYGCLALGLAVTTLQLTQPGDAALTPGIANPLGFGPDLRPLLGSQVAAPLDAFGALVVLPVIVLAVWARYRAGASIERQQLKWFCLASATTSIAVTATSVAAATGSGTTSQVPLLAMAITATAIPVAIGIAILRYHLYAIDRIVSRTIAYTVVIGALGLLFSAIVIGLSNLFVSWAQGEAIAVAASTLIVFAAFQPLARRVRRWVDRRFNRAHYDAERTAVAFSIRLRDEVDLETVADDLADTVRQAVDPTVSGLWIRTSSR